MLASIPDFPGFYATDDGVIYKATANGIEEATCHFMSGYVRTYIDRKAYYVHRLIYQTFGGVIKSGYVVSHKNDIKHDNRIENLELATPKQNTLRALENGRHPVGMRQGNAKLKDNDILRIFDMRHKGMTYAKIADEFDVSEMVICGIINGKAWKHISLPPKFEAMRHGI